MYVRILNDIFEERVTIEDFKSWLVLLKDLGPELCEYNNPVARMQFVSEFLNLLHEEAASVCTPLKKVEEVTITSRERRLPQKTSVVDTRRDEHQYRDQTTAWKNLASVEAHRPEGKHANNSGRGRSRNFSLEDFITKAVPQSSGRKKRVKTVRVESHRKCLPDADDAVVMTHLCPPSADSSQLSGETPDISKVTNIEIINRLCDVYCTLIDINFVPNIVTELRFILGLLLVQNVDERKADSSRNSPPFDFFHSVHNCVYFASLVLSKNKHFLNALNYGLRRLLVESGRLQVFAPEVLQILEESYNAIRSQPGAPPSDFIAFQPDRDSRQNFPHDRSFNMFRKQRDQFYEVKAIWEKLHKMPDFSFGASLAVKVKTILACGDTCNMFHLARLFRMQLLQSCFSCDQVEGVDGSDNAAAEDTSVVDKLNMRLESASASTASTATHTSFSGRQQFFRDFILTAATVSPVFIQYLTDNIVYELHSLNNTIFTPSDIETGSVPDEDRVVQYERCVGCAVLLAKFLGLVVFLPYHTTDSQIPEHILESHWALRVSTRPPIDILACLDTAWRLRRLSITLPWVVHFLMTIDEVSSRTPYYCWTYRLLCLIYRNLATASDCRSPATTFMLKLVLGWLFDSHYFPKPIFWRWCILENINTEIETSARGEDVDNMELVDRRTLYRCCPHLADLQLPQWYAESSNVKYVAPLQVKEVTHSYGRSNTEDCITEDSLVDNFLHTQPVSVTHMIDTLTEYVTSSLIKHALHTFAPRAKATAAKKLDVLFSSGVANLQPTEINQHFNFIKEQLKIATLIIGQEFVSEMNHLCAGAIPKLCARKIHAALWSLLPDHNSQQMKSLCLYIVVGKCLKRFDRWFERHVNDRSVVTYLSSIVNTRMNIAAKKQSDKSSNTLPPEGRKVTHDDSAPSPDEAVEKLRSMVQLLHEVDDEATADVNKRVKEAMSDALSSITYRSDMTPSAEGLIYTLSLDLAVSLVARFPDTITGNGLLKEFVKLWTCPELRLQGAPPDVSERLVSPRNVRVLLSATQEQEKVWSGLASLVQCMVQTGSLSLDSVSCQFLSLFRHTWSKENFMLFKLCLSRITSDKCIAESEDAELLLNLLQDYFEEFQLEEEEIFD